MKKIIISLAIKVILLFLVFLGFSCSSDDDSTNYAEHGTPSADFKATGAVFDKATLTRLSNIQVAMDGDTIYSDANGIYTIIAHNSPGIQEYNISFIDTDSIYFPCDTIIDFSDEEFENGDSWYEGMKTLQVDIKLKSNELPDTVSQL